MEKEKTKKEGNRDQRLKRRTARDLYSRFIGSALAPSPSPRPTPRPTIAKLQSRNPSRSGPPSIPLFYLPHRDSCFVWDSCSDQVSQRGGRVRRQEINFL
jgi:hypothetical protein